MQRGTFLIYELPSGCTPHVQLIFSCQLSKSMVNN